MGWWVSVSRPVDGVHRTPDITLERTGYRKSYGLEGDIRGAMHAINWSRDGDPPAHVWPMGSGPSALLVRYKAGARHISNSDQMFHEFGAAYRHYHAAMTLTVITGKPDPLHTEMFSVCRAAL